MQETATAGAAGSRQEALGGRRKTVQVLRRRTIKIDYKDAGLLKYFITDRGKLVPRRISGNCAKHQREIAAAVTAPA